MNNELEQYMNEYEVERDEWKIYNREEALIADAFLGDIPYEQIFEYIVEQFDNYNELADDTNYVDYFYEMLEGSRRLLDEDDSEENPLEIKEILDNIEIKFTELMKDLIQVKLTISIQSLESGDIYDEDIPSIVSLIYDFFILNAHDHFKAPIIDYIMGKIDEDDLDSVDFHNNIEDIINADLSPLLYEITLREFLESNNAFELIDLYDEGIIVGNFLRKYSPQYYKNQENMVDLLNEISMKCQDKYIKANEPKRNKKRIKGAKKDHGEL